MAPAHQKIYCNLDKAVGHFRRYEKDFFYKRFKFLTLINFKFLDSMGYLLYLLFNKKKKENFFLWDKIFTPITIIVDFITSYKFGKCIISIYKKN